MHLDQIDTHAQETTGDGSKESEQPKLPFELSAESLSYELEENIIVGEGDSQLRRGHELIMAQVIHYDVTRRIAYAQPDPGGRVLVRFYSNPDMPLFPTRTLASGSAAE